MKSPCFNCIDRKISCHATCEKYLKYKKKNKELNDKIRKLNNENYDVFYSMKNKNYKKSKKG